MIKLVPFLILGLFLGWLIGEGLDFRIKKLVREECTKVQHETSRR